MAERTPVVKKYRDALETVIGATMEFLAQHPQPSTSTSTDTTLNTAPHTPEEGKPESYARAPPRADVGPETKGAGGVEEYGYVPQALTPGSLGRGEGRQGEMGQMDAEWMLSLCEGDGFSLSMLNEMMRFEPSLGA